MNMNRIYEAPELTVTLLSNQDILTASTGDSEMAEFEW